VLIDLHEKFMGCVREKLETGTQGLYFIAILLDRGLLVGLNWKSLMGREWRRKLRGFSFRKRRSPGKSKARKSGLPRVPKEELNT